MSRTRILGLVCFRNLAVTTAIKSPLCQIVNFTIHLTNQLQILPQSMMQYVNPRLSTNEGPTSPMHSPLAASHSCPLPLSSTSTDSHYPLESLAAPAPPSSKHPRQFNSRQPIDVVLINIYSFSATCSLPNLLPIFMQDQHYPTSNPLLWPVGAHTTRQNPPFGSLRSCRQTHIFTCFRHTLSFLPNYQCERES